MHSSDSTYVNNLIEDMFNSLEGIDKIPVPKYDHNYQLIDLFFQNWNQSHTSKTRNYSKIKILLN